MRHGDYAIIILVSKMRIRLFFLLEKEQFPLQYRKSIMSFIKKSLQQYNQNLYDRFYHQKDPIIKPYTFAIFFHEPKFEKTSIKLQDKSFTMTMAIADEKLGQNFYESFLKQKNSPFSLYCNSMTVKEVYFLPEEKISSNLLNIKFMSPLVVREHHVTTRKDYYYSFERKEFLGTLKRNIKEEIRISSLSSKIIDEFECVPIQPKRTVVKFYEKQIEVSMGSYQIKGDTLLLQYLYQAGMGSKRSSGFGMFSIIP